MTLVGFFITCCVGGSPEVVGAKAELLEKPAGQEEQAENSMAPKMFENVRKNHAVPRAKPVLLLVPTDDLSSKGSLAA